MKNKKFEKLYESIMKENEDKFTYEDAAEMVIDDLDAEEKGIKAALKALKVKKLKDIYIKYETPEDSFDYDEFESKNNIKINSELYDTAEFGTYDGDNVVVFSDGEDYFAYVKK